MRKLLDREPTEEMLGVLSFYPFSARVVYQNLFDAAPEVKVDMEPFGYLKRVHTSKCYLGNLSSDRPKEDPLGVYLTSNES